MIRSFADKETERLFQRVPVKRFPPPVRRAALRKLLVLDAADSLDDLRVTPGNRLEKLRGDRAGQYSVRINDQWRLCFRWGSGDAFDVEVTDYH
jgi:proteic killer suppression protein